MVLDLLSDPMILYRTSATEIRIVGLPREQKNGFFRTLGATTLGDQWYMIDRSNNLTYNPGIVVRVMINHLDEIRTKEAKGLV